MTSVPASPTALSAHVCTEECFEYTFICPLSMQTIPPFGKHVRIFLDKNRAPNLPVGDVVKLLGKWATPFNICVSKERNLLNGELMIPMCEVTTALYKMSPLEYAKTMCDELECFMCFPKIRSEQIYALELLKNNGTAKITLDSATGAGVGVNLETGCLNLCDLVYVAYLLAKCSSEVLASAEIRRQIIDEIGLTLLRQGYDFYARHRKYDANYVSVTICDALVVLACLPYVSPDIREQLADSLCLQWGNDPRSNPLRHLGAWWDGKRLRQILFVRHSELSWFIAIRSLTTTSVSADLPRLAPVVVADAPTIPSDPAPLVIAEPALSETADCETPKANVVPLASAPIVVSSGPNSVVFVPTDYAPSQALVASSIEARISAMEAAISALVRHMTPPPVTMLMCE